jgi:hypothetical protein
MTSRVDRARQLRRKVVREARDKNRWRKIVKVRLWMPVGLQVVLVVGLAWFTDTRFPGFISSGNVNQILLLALPLTVAALAQTHALLVGYLDLSVGAMISLGVVIASFLIGVDAGVTQILAGTGVIALAAAASSTASRSTCALRPRARSALISSPFSGPRSAPFPSHSSSS